MGAIFIPGIGAIDEAAGFVWLESSNDGRFRTGQHGVVAIVATGDRKVEFIAFRDHTLAYVRSAMGYPAYYPVHDVEMRRPIKAVLMDLDGTTIRSEDFWMRIIEKTTASLLNKPNFRLQEADSPFVSGHSVSEHLKYCIHKYCPGESIDKARDIYFEHTQRELQAALDGKGEENAFLPSPGIKEFLIKVKALGIKIGLVTSGLYEKAWPEIISGFRRLDLGKPTDFYDAIITAGFPLRKGQAGTLGELSPKPHPWLYAEVSRIGLGIPFEERNSVIGIEDSGAGICSIRLAGFPAIGIQGGNILSSGTRALCNHYCASFEEIFHIITTG
jgi:beta-phosphoglucomutase-like phosphatase (HAD superfamily)